MIEECPVCEAELESQYFCFGCDVCIDCCKCIEVKE